MRRFVITMSKRKERKQMNKVVPIKSPVEIGMQEAREIRYCGKTPDRSSAKKINKAVESLNDEQWIIKKHKELCKRKLLIGLDLVSKYESNGNTLIETKSEPVVAEIVVKRKRGRPKKVVVDVVEETTNPTETPIIVPKRKRGRPRKQIQAELQVET